MANNTIVGLIKEKVRELSIEDGTILVLKGIPMNVLVDDYSPTFLEDIVSSKFKYFTRLITNNTQIITYEEFLLLNSFILDQFEKVIVLNNNLYINQYPLDAKLHDATKKGLLVHFGESDNDNDDTFIGNIDEIIDLYAGIKEYNGYLIGSYREEKVPTNDKVVTINLFECEDVQIKKVESTTSGDMVIALEDESNYIDLVKMIFDEPEELYVNYVNYLGDIDVLENRLSIITSYWNDTTDIYAVLPKEAVNTFEHREEYSEILKKYWGYDSFRSFSVYNLQKLADDKIETVEVSQEQIVSDLVQQAENCMKEDVDARDVFVTAPTGSGKSVMFQIPAIYLAEKYGLLTIVVSPLIGLMNDQVNNLQKKQYKGARTINSDISPILKQEILEEVANGNLDILYLSPETLLARSDVEQLIGDREIGMIVIDEAHIVTTWGKQFRPDYWYLGEHIRRLRSNQQKKHGKSFVIGTFTATAIYGGPEDMYDETRNSLHLIDPISYLGYVKRNDIEIRIDATKKAAGERSEYEMDKFEDVVNLIKRAILTNKKTLIYFPTVSLISRCWNHLLSKKMTGTVARYNGQMPKEMKDENYKQFYNGEKLVMLATKAFGMGIDINDIEIVAHFAPTGNVCDYVQEIGRAARKEELTGEAFYHYNSRDFKYINRLHGLSSVKEYQIIEVIKKINELYELNRAKGSSFTKKRNAMLVDAENFTYIFNNPLNEGDDNINKVKTALLIIQKDFESINGFSPIVVRPIPLFSQGFFSVEPTAQKKIKKHYGDCIEEIYEKTHICRINLQTIWEKGFTTYSFPQFKYLLYTKSEELSFNKDYDFIPALVIKINREDNYQSRFNAFWNLFKRIAHDSIKKQEFIDLDSINRELCTQLGISKYKASTISEVVFASMDIYTKKYSRGFESIVQKRELNNGSLKYMFRTAIDSYFSWVENTANKINKSIDNGHIYVINDNNTIIGEINTVLGILDVMDIMDSEISGGANSQLYIYINQIRTIQNIVDNPRTYRNRLLEKVSDRHLISVKMLTYIYEGKYESDKIWDIIEQYFLGKMPEEVKKQCLKENPNILLY